MNMPPMLAVKGYEKMHQRLHPCRVPWNCAAAEKIPLLGLRGQKQSAAVASALIPHPEIILTDESTGALDFRANDELLRLFGEINRFGQITLTVTHSVKAASFTSRVLFIRDGEVFHR